LQIDRAPLACRDVRIAAPAGERRREEIAGPRRGDVRERPVNVAQRKVHQTVATQHQIDPRERVAQQIEVAELATGCRIRVLVARHQVRDDVGADIGNACQIDLTHPLEVTARNIEYRPDIQLP